MNVSSPVKESAGEAVGRFLTPEIIQRINRPTAEATGLPNEAFTSSEFLDLEKQLLFRRTWMCAGFVQDIPEPGDIMPTSIGGVPIILTRAQDGEVRAFHNVCRHRGTQLVTESKSGMSSISCPYHGWTYDLDGKLRRRAHFAGPDKEGSLAGIRLFEVPCGIWEHLIFVNIDAQAPPLETFMQPVRRQLEGYDFSALVFAEEMTWTIESNWKFV